MQFSKDRAANAAKKLSDTKGLTAILNTKLRNVLKVFLGDDNYDAKADNAIGEPLKNLLYYMNLLFV